MSKFNIVFIDSRVIVPVLIAVKIQHEEYTSNWIAVMVWFSWDNILKNEEHRINIIHIALLSEI